MGEGGTAALASALVLAAAVAVAVALRLRPARGRSVGPRPSEPEMPQRLRQIVDALQESRRSEAGVDRSLRPLLAPIATARLGRHGIDMTLAPRRAEELLGHGLWEIVRPDRPAAGLRVGGGLGEDDLRAAIERLEEL